MASAWFVASSARHSAPGLRSDVREEASTSSPAVRVAEPLAAVLQLGDRRSSAGSFDSAEILARHPAGRRSASRRDVDVERCQRRRNGTSTPGLAVRRVVLAERDDCSPFLAGDYRLPLRRLVGPQNATGASTTFASNRAGPSSSAARRCVENGVGHARLPPPRGRFSASVRWRSLWRSSRPGSCRGPSSSGC